MLIEKRKKERKNFLLFFITLLAYNEFYNKCNNVSAYSSNMVLIWTNYLNLLEPITIAIPISIAFLVTFTAVHLNPVL